MTFHLINISTSFQWLFNVKSAKKQFRASGTISSVTTTCEKSRRADSFDRFYKFKYFSRRSEFELLFLIVLIIIIFVFWEGEWLCQWKSEAEFFIAFYLMITDYKK